MWDPVAQTQFKPAYFELPEPQKQISLVDMFRADDNFNFSKASFTLMKPIFRGEFLTEHKLEYNEEMKVGEDFTFYIESLFNGAKIVLINEAYYIYSMPSSPSGRSPHSRSIQDVRKLPGVISTRVGYTGGDVPNATYRNHHGHAEAIEITFDPDRTSYRDLLEFFFQIHDPSTLNRQGNDMGTSYRSAIFYLSDAQRQTAEDTIADVDASGLWPGKVVTEVTPAGPFWEAEPEHQDYLERLPEGYTCHFPRAGWVLPRRNTSPASTAKPNAHRM